MSAWMGIEADFVSLRSIYRQHYKKGTKVRKNSYVTLTVCTFNFLKTNKI